MKQEEFNFDGVTFSELAGKAAKQAGTELAASTRAELLDQVRCALVDIAMSRPSREACADDGQAWLIAHGRKPADLGNAAGSLFPKSHWVFTGRWKFSARVSRHANSIRIWKLK